jgi:endogenous inhibitor of DNA gyrase (YacG/DUF329 family)
MKNPCPICGKYPVVYAGAEHCSYDCWAQSIDLKNRALGIVTKEEEVEEDPIEEVVIEVQKEEVTPPVKKRLQLNLY